VTDTFSRQIISGHELDVVTSSTTAIGRAVAAALPHLQHPGVPAVAVGKAGTQHVEQLLDHVLVQQVSGRLAAGVEVARFARVIIFSAMRAAFLARGTVVVIRSWSSSVVTRLRSRARR